MTNRDELTAAVERLRRVKAGESIYDAYHKIERRIGESMVDLYHRDHKTLADAYLATVAADEQLSQGLQADAKYFDGAAAWAKKEWNEQAASMAKEAADRFRAALNIALQPSEQETQS